MTFDRQVRSLEVKAGIRVICYTRASVKEVVGKNQGHREGTSEFPNPSKANPIQPSKQIPENQSPVVV